MSRGADSTPPALLGLIHEQWCLSAENEGQPIYLLLLSSYKASSQRSISFGYKVSHARRRRRRSPYTISKSCCICKYELCINNYKFILLNRPIKIKETLTLTLNGLVWKRGEEKEGRMEGRVHIWGAKSQTPDLPRCRQERVAARNGHYFDN